MDEIKNPISLINKDYETINLVTFEEWLEDSDKLSRLGVGLILDPSNDAGLIKESLDSIVHTVRPRADHIIWSNSIGRNRGKY